MSKSLIVVRLTEISIMTLLMSSEQTADVQHPKARIERHNNDHLNRNSDQLCGLSRLQRRPSDGRKPESRQPSHGELWAE